VTDALIPAPEPRLALSGQDIATFRDQQVPGFGDFLGASAGEGAWGTVIGQALARNRVRQAELSAPAEELRELDEPGWRQSDFYREGLPFRPGLTTAGARAIAEIFDENVARRQLMQRYQPGPAGMAAGFAAGVVGALPTPENFIPFAGPALRAAQTQRYSQALRNIAEAAQRGAVGSVGARAAAGAGTGALDGFLGSLATLPFVNASRDDFGDDVTWADMLLDLALGTAAGGAIGAGAGAALGRNAGLPNPARQEAALRGLTGAADQIAQRDAIDLAALPPDARAELEALRAETRRLRERLMPEDPASISARAAARPMMGSSAAAPGVTGRATTPAGTEMGFAYELVELDDLVASHTLPDFRENPAFPQALQPRDRGSAERQQQVREIAARLRPEEVEASPLTTTGAPIVGPDGVVESGNGRTLAIAEAYGADLPTAGTYRQYLIRLGFDAAAGMRRPVLIRRRTTDLDDAGRRRLTEESNVDVTDRLTPAEQARVDAGRMDAPMLALLRSGDVLAAQNADFVRAFIGSLTGRDQRELSAGGALTADGQQRITRALIARAYPDADLVGRLAQSPDAAAEGLGRGLVQAAPAIARLRALIEAGQVRAELDAVPALLRAIQRIEGARAANRPLSTLFDQLDAFDQPSPLEQAWLAMLLRHPVRQQVGGVGYETIATRLESYATRAAEAPDAPDMFGTPPPGIGPVMAAALREAGLESTPELRALAADPYAPPPERPVDPPAAPPPAARSETAPAPARDPEAAAAEQGLDLDDGTALAEAGRLLEEGRIPEELAAALRDVDAMAAKLERADDAWQAATTCALGG
jgi:hypothetical protein